MKNLIDWESPDLAILTGDMVSGYAWDGKTSGWYQKQWQKWTQAFEEKQLNYMYVQGNHDSQADLSRDAIADLDMSLNFSLTEKGPKEIHGTSNYVKPVYDQNGEEKLFYLWAFDSMSDNCEEVTGWGCVYPDTVEWYRETSKKLLEEDGKVIPGYAFFHIPIPEYMEMQNNMKFYGLHNEDVCCFSVNTGLYGAFKEMGNIEATFCGHDHNNDYWGDFYGIKLFYGRKTGHGGYGPPVGMQRGARILEFSLDSSNEVQLDSWIRQEDGSKQEQSAPWWPPKFLQRSQELCCGMHVDEEVFLEAN